MPQIDVHLIKGVFDTEQKRQIIQRLTDAMVSVEGENAWRDMGEDFRGKQR